MGCGDLLRIPVPRATTRLAGGADEIVFQAADGYSPNVAISQLASHPAFLAYEEKGRKRLERGYGEVAPAP